MDLPYVNSLTEIASGPALAVFALLRKQKHRCELQIPTRHKAVYAAPLFANKKAPVRVLFNWRRGRDLNPRNLAVYRFSRPAVSTTHTPLQLYTRRVAGPYIYIHYTKFYRIWATGRPLRTGFNFRSSKIYGCRMRYCLRWT